MLYNSAEPSSNQVVTPYSPSRPGQLCVISCVSVARRLSGVGDSKSLYPNTNALVSAVPPPPRLGFLRTKTRYSPTPESLRATLTHEITHNWPGLEGEY